MQPITADQISKFLELLKSGKVSRSQFQKRLENPNELIAFLKGINFDWIEAIVAKNQAWHIAFFGEDVAGEFDYSKLRATLAEYGQEKIKALKPVFSEIVYLPWIEMSQDKTFPGWKVKPRDWFYEMVQEGRIAKEALDLGDIIVAVDTRCKPAFDSGKQMWEDDEVVGGIVQQLRKEGKIPKYEYGPQNSRFGVSAHEAEKFTFPALTEKLGLKEGQIRSEKAIEFNVLSQMLFDVPRAQDGTTNTWVWLADHFEGVGRRLVGGHSDCGGLGIVSGDPSGSHWDSSSFRALAVLS